MRFYIEVENATVPQWSPYKVWIYDDAGRVLNPMGWPGDNLAALMTRVSQFIDSYLEGVTA